MSTVLTPRMKLDVLREGLLSYERARQPRFIEDKAGQIDEEVTRFVEEAHQKGAKKPVHSTECFK